MQFQRFASHITGLMQPLYWSNNIENCLSKKKATMEFKQSDLTRFSDTTSQLRASDYEIDYISDIFERFSLRSFLFVSLPHLYFAKRILSKSFLLNFYGFLSRFDSFVSMSYVLRLHYFLDLQFIKLLPSRAVSTHCSKI